MIALLAAALAAPLSPTGGTGFVEGAGHGSFGIFRPVRIGVSEKTDIVVPGISALVAPQLGVKRQVAGDRENALAVTAGVGVPTFGLRLLQSSATVLSTDPEATIGFGAVAKAGVVGGIRRGPVVMGLGFEGRVGVGGGAWGLDSPGLWFVDPMLAPLLEGPVLRSRYVLQMEPTERLAITADYVLAVGGGGLDQSLRAFVLGGLSERVALGAGWILASETFEGGIEDTLGFPLADLQVRW